MNECFRNILGTLPLPSSGCLVHRLPIEILAQIFMFCLSLRMPLLGNRAPSASGNQVPLLLCHVCSSWRQIALQTRALWTSLVMEISLEDTWEVPERHSQVASHWFSQAGSHLVDLVVRSDVNPESDTSFHVPDNRYLVDFMMQLVRPRVERIRSLHLSFQGLYDICCLLQFQDDEDVLPHHVWSFPNLEYLTLKLGIYVVEGVELTALQSLPKLHTVVLSSIIISHEGDIHLPWAQLTSLTIHDIDAPIFRILVAQFVALETGCFSIRDPDFEEELPTVNVTLTRLTTFIIYYVNDFAPSILDGIHFPALDNLTLFLNNSVWTAPEHIFRQLASITTLSLGEHIAALDMINILRAANNVTKFQVEVEDGHGEVLKALTLTRESENQEVLLPKLRVMHVRTCPRSDSEPFAVVAFVEMVASRSPSGVEAFGVAPLREVCLAIPEYSDMLVAEVDALLEQWAHKADMPQVRYEDYEEY